MNWRAILSAVRRALWPTVGDFQIGQCTACLFETDGLEQTTSGLMCPSCARGWREHEAESAIPDGLVSMEITVRDLTDGQMDVTRRRIDEAIARHFNASSALGQIPPPPPPPPERVVAEGRMLSQDAINEAARRFMPALDRCRSGGRHDWLPWMTVDRGRQGDICGNCGETRREAIAVERPPIPCQHVWVVEDDMAANTTIARCRICAERHVEDRGVLEDGWQGFTARLLNEHGGRILPPRFETSDMSRFRVRREIVHGSVPPSMPPAAPPRAKPPAEEKPKRLQPGAPKPPRPIKLD